MGKAQGAGGVQKKNLAEALIEWRNKGTTSHDLLKCVIVARKVNAVCGFGAVIPNDVLFMDEEWRQLYEGLYEIEFDKSLTRAQMKESKDRFDQILARRRVENASYRKY